jgi:universal stress protein E
MTDSTRTMVVGVATTAELDPVLPFALELAGARGAELHVVHAFDFPEYLAFACSRRAGPRGARPDRLAEEVEARLREQVARFPGPAPVACHARVGPPAERLAAHVAEVGADLLVVGATRRGRIVRGVLGAAAERVIGVSPAPTLVFREPLFREVRRVLFATDLSELNAGACTRALGAVEALFGAGELELRTVFVAETELLPGLPLESRVVEEAAREELGRFVAGLDVRGRAVSAALRVGEPAREINCEARAWKADLLVLGSHGRTGMPWLRFGSVAAATVRGAGCNVLVVPAGPSSASRAPSRAERALATA